MVCDGSGRPIHIAVAAGNVADISYAYQCLGGLIGKGVTFIADRGYDAKELRDWLSKLKARACIPPRKNRNIQYRYDRKLHKTRNTIEQCFCKIKDWRQLSLRTFRSPKTVLAAAHIAAIVIWYL